VRTPADLSQARALVHEVTGPTFLQIKVSTEKAPMVLPPRDGAYLRSRFQIELRKPS
jgi:hypothetical protein